MFNPLLEIELVFANGNPIVITKTISPKVCLHFFCFSLKWMYRILQEEAAAEEEEEFLC
jgi:hypothetical protein